MQAHAIKGFTTAVLFDGSKFYKKSFQSWKEIEKLWKEAVGKAPDVVGNETDGRYYWFRTDCLSEKSRQSVLENIREIPESFVPKLGDKVFGKTIGNGICIVDAVLLKTIKEEGYEFLDLLE
jgi:hypothetical protein